MQIPLIKGIATAVFGIGPATQIYLAVGATDMRKRFEGWNEFDIKGCWG